ncbi:unnamed protein product [Rhizoctonia solani]|uniref:Enoyl reductase (ER) domain-containing protein n=1 Tax=Rhizoctonia solani TaxID=456999 RepID=A0A8H3G9C1_9AGAM|nr:unnamed protein product [Rhizoctonia solani]
MFLIDEISRPFRPEDIVEIHNSSETEHLLPGTICSKWDHVFEWDDNCVKASTLEGWRHHSDNLCDEALLETFPDLSSSTGIDLLDAIEQRAEQGPGAARNFIDHVKCIPPEGVKASDDQIRRGQAFFYAYSSPILAGLMHFSLAGGFASARITRVLHTVSYLVPGKSNKAGEYSITPATSDRTFKRLLETLQMVLDAMGGNTSLVERESKALRPGVHELAPGEEGWRSVVRVRLLHGVARRRIMERVRHPDGDIPGYDFNVDGYPINQEDLAATLSSFCSAPLFCLSRLGYYPSISEKEDYIALWRHIGYYMGVDPEILSRHFANLSINNKFLASTVASDDQIRRGQAFFYTYSSPILAGLMHFSLAGGFASARITRVLHAVSYLVPGKSSKAGEYAITPATSERTFKRLLETLQMVLDTMGGNTSLVEREGKAVRPGVHDLAPGEEGWRSVVRVRLLHGVARRRIMERVRHPEGGIPGYDFNADGYPINQEDLAATLSSFCSAPLICLTRLGYHPSVSEKEDYIALWRHIGYYMGVDPEILSRHFSSLSVNNKFLASTVAHLLENPDPEASRLPPPTMPILHAISHRPPFPSTFAYHCALTRFLVGDRLADHLQIPKTPLLEYYRLRTKLLLTKLPYYFGKVYRLRNWESRRVRISREGLSRVVRWQMGMRRTAFRPRLEDGEIAPGVEQSEAVVPNMVLGQAFMREYNFLIREMLGVIGGVVLSVLAMVNYYHDNKPCSSVHMPNPPSNIPKTQKAVVCPGPGQPWTVLNDVPVPIPRPHDVLIKVIAVGLCGGDGVLRAGGMPGLDYPIVAGHEIVGRIVGLGNEVESSSGTSIWKWTVGQRVGVGWNAGRCQKCYYCRSGNPQGCSMAHATALTRDGGLAEYTTAHFTALVPYPDELSSLQAPLLCAGLTCFNSLRHTRAKPGDSVLIIGCGGLGHVAIPLARAMGFRSIVLSRTEAKRKLAMELGAEAFIVSQVPTARNESDDPLVKEIIGIVDRPFGGSGPGGVNIVLQTAPEEETLRRVTGALAMDAEIILLSEPDSMKIDLPLMPFLIKRASIRGWTAGVPTDAHDTLRFCVQTGVRCIVETTTMENAEAAYTNMSKALFRTVVVIDGSEVEKERR